MKLKYETGTATLIQFIVLGLLNIANGLQSIITTCHHQGGDCVGNLLSSIIFYILTIAWFGFVTILGYGAQEKRNKRIVQALICAEVLIALVALFNIKLYLHHHSAILGLITSFIDLVLSVWVIEMAWRLMRAGGGRVVINRGRNRRS